MLHRRVLCCLCLVATACQGAGGDAPECAAVDCGLYGICAVEAGEARCLCDAGFVADGLSCHEDPCRGSPCVYGTCTPSGKNALCDCDAGYAGLRCDMCAPGYRVDGLTCVAGSPCVDDPCVYGQCRSVAGEAVCECHIGYSGKACDTCAPGYHPENLRCVSDTACDPDPCVHGTCSEQSGAALCACDTGYAGLRCDQCAPGFIEQGFTCVPEVGGVCDPNPCDKPNRSICVPAGEDYTCDCDPGYQDVEGACIQVTDVCEPNPCTETNRHVCEDNGSGGFTCSCDPGYDGPTCLECATDYQDNDHNDTCLPACSITDCGEASCDDSSGDALCGGLRPCDTELNHDPGQGSVTAVYVRGEFNDWDLSHRLVKIPDGSYTISLDLPAGDYAYKLYDQGADSWFLDPKNPYTKWVGGQQNSRLRVPDCDRPLLKLLGQPSVLGGDIAFSAQYIDGAQGSGVDLATVSATRNDVVLNSAFEASTGTFTIADTGLSPGKYTYRFVAKDQAGRAAEQLYVPLWAESTPFQWQDAVLYFVLTDRFIDGDTANNAPVAGVDTRANWQGGDFAGLTAKIEAGYFNSLGVNALWISSISENTAGAGLGSDNRQYSGYHSYWPTSTGWRDDNELAGFSPVDPHFGDLDDFKTLVAAAHNRGIRVLVDFVANHVHTDSPLWSNHSDYFHDAGSPYVCGWDKPITCWFTDYLPDFEYKRLEVMDTVVEHAIWMIQETGIDGFRLDAVKHMIDDFSYTLRGRIQKSVNTTGLRFYMVGETFTGEGQGAADTIKHYVRPEMLDGQFDFPLYWQITKTFLREDQDLRGLSEMLAWNDGYYGPWAVMSNFLGNHDVPRALSHANGNISDLWGNGSKEQAWNDPPSTPSHAEPYARLRLAWTFMLTVPGVPLIYYGDEFGLAGAGDPDNRRFFPAPDNLNDEQQATLAHVQKLTAARHAHPAMRHGSREELHMDTDGLFWGYGLAHGGDAVVVVINRSTGSRTRSVPIPALGLSEGSTLTEVVAGGTVTVDGGAIEVTVGGRSGAVWVLE